MTLKSEIHKSGDRNKHYCAFRNLSPLVLDVVSDLFGNYLEINFNLRYTEETWYR